MNISHCQLPLKIVKGERISLNSKNESYVVMLGKFPYFKNFNNKRRLVTKSEEVKQSYFMYMIISEEWGKVYF